MNFINRLFILGYEIGCVSKERYDKLIETEKEISAGIEILLATNMSRYKWRKALGFSNYAESNGVSR